MEETNVHDENHRPVPGYWKTLSQSCIEHIEWGDHIRHGIIVGVCEF